MQQNSFDWKEKLKAFKIPILILATILIVTSCNFLMKLRQQSLYIGLLPKKIEVSNIIYGSQICFFVVFNLSAKSVDAINREGISFFKNATEARAYDIKIDRYNMYHLYKEWQKTPVQDVDNNRSFLAGTQCMLDHDFVDFDKSSLGLIRIAAQGSKSFYTGHSQGQLVVIPSLGIAVISGIGD